MRSLLLAAAAMVLTASHAQAADAVKGKMQFGPCTACHTVDPAKPDLVGPNLFGIVGKKAATIRKGYAYSPALKASGLVWDEKTLDAWLKSPATLVPKTKMEYVGMTRAETRANVIEYLKTAK
jgi:cytochrome c